MTNTIIINQINPKSENEACSFCTKRHNQQMELINDFKDLYGEEFVLKELEMQSHEIRGVGYLEDLANLWNR